MAFGEASLMSQSRHFHATGELPGNPNLHRSSQFEGQSEVHSGDSFLQVVVIMRATSKDFVRHIGRIPGHGQARLLFGVGGKQERQRQ